MSSSESEDEKDIDKTGSHLPFVEAFKATKCLREVSEICRFSFLLSIVV